MRFTMKRKQNGYDFYNKYSECVAYIIVDLRRRNPYRVFMKDSMRNCFVNDSCFESATKAINFVQGLTD